VVNQLPEGNIGGDDDRLHGLRVCPVFVEEPSLLCNQVIKGKLSDNSEFHPAPGEKGNALRLRALKSRRVFEAFVYAV
jgi:hypothetical protein